MLDGFEFDRSLLQQFRPSLDTSVPSLTPLISEPSKLFLLAGVDEAGRGPLAGPVVAAAVILPGVCEIEGLRDSKLVPPEQREALYCEIMEEATDVAVAVVASETIDQINILAASLLAMRQAVADLIHRPFLVAVDGNQKPNTGFLEQAIVKGDQKSASISAASIVAKVIRDGIMDELHKEYPQYGFDSHRGYGCAEHIEAIRRHGPSPIHRMTFEPLKSLLAAPSWSFR